MNRALAILLLALLTSPQTMAQTDPSTSAAFESILSRVVERDSGSGGIVLVSALSGSADPKVRLKLKIKIISRSSIALVELRNEQNRREVYESYRLKLTPEIEDESDKLAAASLRGTRGPIAAKPSFVFLRVPHLRQGHNLCAPTSASMVLLHFGKRIAPEQIKSMANAVTANPDFAGTYFIDIVKGLKTVGCDWRTTKYAADAEGFQRGFADIIASLDEGNPVIIDTNVPPDGHTVVVNGYDPNRRLVAIVDPFIPAPGLRQVTYAEFMELWKSVIAESRGLIFTKSPEAKSD